MRDDGHVHEVRGDEEKLKGSCAGVLRLCAGRSARDGILVVTSVLILTLSVLEPRGISSISPQVMYDGTNLDPTTDFDALEVVSFLHPSTDVEHGLETGSTFEGDVVHQEQGLVP
jgi:hypothetical protein